MNMVTNLNERSLSDLPWCRYVFWHRAATDGQMSIPTPTEMPGQKLFDDIHGRIGTTTKKDAFTVKINGDDFGKAICFRSKTDLVVSEADAIKLLGELQNLGLPDFICIDESSSGSIDLSFWLRLFSKTKKTVSHVAGTAIAEKTPLPDFNNVPQESNSPGM